MKYFSVPADFRKETIDEYVKLNNAYKNSKVIETYGNLTINNMFGSGRSHSQLPKIDLAGLKDFIAYSLDKGIHFNYTLNASYIENKEFTREGVLQIKTFFKELQDAGVRSLTLTLPSLFELVKASGFEFQLKASAICSIDNPNIALAFKRMGAGRIVIKELINRDFGNLKRISSVFGPGCEIIVNSPCHMDCSYRMSHYNQQAGDSVLSTNDVSFNYYEHKCMVRRYSDLSNWLKIIWVRPEDLKYYTQIGINHFKLQGRQTVIKGGSIVKVTEAYFQEDYDGDLVDLINSFAPLNSFKVNLDNKKLEGFLKPFVEKDDFCIRDCTRCTYCDDFARQCLELDKAEEVTEMARKFYHDYDEYAKIVKTLEPEEKARLSKDMQEEGDFDF